MAYSMYQLIVFHILLFTVEPKKLIFLLSCNLNQKPFYYTLQNIIFRSLHSFTQVCGLTTQMLATLVSLTSVVTLRSQLIRNSVYCTKGTINFHRACRILNEFKGCYISDFESQVRSNKLNRQKSTTVLREGMLLTFTQTVPFYLRYLLLRYHCEFRFPSWQCG